jgi:hypothetical protein
LFFYGFSDFFLIMNGRIGDATFFTLFLFIAFSAFGLGGVDDGLFYIDNSDSFVFFGLFFISGFFLFLSSAISLGLYFL